MKYCLITATAICVATLHAPAVAQSRFPADMQAAAVPDDSDAARQAALTRLQRRPRQTVCDGGTSDAPMRLGTACSSREFAAPPILTEPRVQWTSHPGYWTYQPFVLAGDRIFAANCLDNRIKEGGSFAVDGKTGKVLWRDRKICEGVEQGEWEDLFTRVFALPDQSLLVASMGKRTRYRQFFFDMKTGRLLAQDKKPLKWANIELLGTQFISRARAKADSSYVAARGLDMGEPQWKLEEFVGNCPRNVSQEDCDISYNWSNMALAGGVLYVSATRKDQGSGPPYRQLHAIDAQTGSVLWRHKNQPPLYQTKDGPKLSDDGSPMVSAGKVIMRITGATGTLFRALDVKDGKELWNTQSIPVTFQDEWLPRNSGRRPVLAQAVRSHLLSGKVLLAHVGSREEGHSDVWAYSLDDGKALWHRSLTINGKDTGLGASAGGVVYLSGGNQLSALEAESGTLLWTFSYADRQTDEKELDNLSLEGAHASQSREHEQGETFWPANWQIGADGGIYIVSPFNMTKLR